LNCGEQFKDAGRTGDGGGPAVAAERRGGGERRKSSIRRPPKSGGDTAARKFRRQYSLQTTEKEAKKLASKDRTTDTADRALAVFIQLQ